MIKVGLVGARGYVGRELIKILDADDRFDLSYASSRQLAGSRLGAQAGLGDLKRFAEFQSAELSPADVAEESADVVVLGLPNGKAPPYVDALLEAGSQAVIIDLGADYRHKEGWVYGSPEINASMILGAKKIANPGCYATAANLALYPIRHLVHGHVSVFGVSGFSGAGTTPGPKNDPERLSSNVLPYGFGGHGHEAEVATFTGLDIVFAPHVAPFFRGLVDTLTIPLSRPCSDTEIRELFESAYANAKNVAISDEPPEASAVAYTDQCVIGGFALSKNGRMLTVSSALDNLRKGAASQALENIVLALGL
ncbi:MAG: N-acetyl-gamma-glutamyl-phosphate reductase [Pseudomonadota bacterium]